MEYQTFVYGLNGDALIKGLGIAVLSTAIVFTVVFGGLRLIRYKNTVGMAIFFTILTFVVCVAGSFIAGVTTADDLNEEIFDTNFSQKYDVQEITFTRSPGRYNINGPTRFEEQNVIVRVEGESKMYVLTQDTETFEPTLTDYDTNEEVTELLRK